MSQSSGVLLSSLGQGLVQFAGVYGDTKTSSLEAEGQRLKEMRLQEIQANRNTLTDAFRIAEYDSSQERLAIAKNVEARAQADFDKPDYFKVPITKYGWVTETKQVFDDMTKTYVNTETREWKATSSGTVFVNKADKTDSFIINADGTRGTVDEASISPTPPKTTTTGTASAVMQTFDTREALMADIVEKHKAAGVELKSGEADTLADKALESGLVALTNAETPSPTADTLSPDASMLYPEFNKIEEETPTTVITDALTIGETNLDSSLRLAAVNDLVKNWASDGLNDNEIRAKLEEKSEDKALTKDQRSAFKEVLKGFTVAPRSHPQTDGMEESPAQLATQEQTIPMGKRFRNPGGSAISVAGIDVSSPVTGPQQLPAQVPPSSGTSYPELMRQMDRNAMDAAGTTPSPVTDPQQLPAGEIPSFSDRVGRSQTELVIESWMGAIPRAIASVMPIEYAQFLKSYPTLKAAREAEANQIGEDKISFTSAWKTVAKWVESQNLDIAPGGGAITEEVLDSAAEASAPATIRAEFGIPPDVNPMPDRTRNPGDTGTGGIISAPPTEEQQKNLGILESLRKQGSFGNKVEPEPVNLAPVGQTVSQAPTSPDTSSNKDAKAQVLEIVAAMEQANIGKEVIRKELLRLLELIKPAEAESPYARALAEVYFEFTKEAN